MHLRHSNRISTNLNSNRRDVDRAPEINGFDVPVVKIGRYVSFEGEGKHFAKYIDGLSEKDRNQRGLSKGWFSVVEGSLFVEYIDLTESYKTLLEQRARPRSFRREAERITEHLSGEVSLISMRREDRAVELIARRQHYIETTTDSDINTDWVAELTSQIDVASRWGSSVFRVLSQPKLVSRTSGEGTYTYGLPLARGVGDKEVRLDLVKLIKNHDLNIPNDLITDTSPVLGIYDMHRELSGMEGKGPEFPRAPFVYLGPIEIHRF